MNSDGEDIQTRDLFLAIKTMNTVNAVLFILVWTFTAVCQADDDVCSISCEEVTGAVGKEVTLTCSVSQKPQKSRSWTRGGS
ncbi:hypothetical protein ABG768_004989 [Culter alburnus]|uniref:Ig-like domain-containing protein n=1 Tax=Culter alburnus TaxID=194366 RepID=A0AAW1ZX62_CULAL